MAAGSQAIPSTGASAERVTDARNSVLVTLDEYLRTAYHPEVDFVENHIEERNLGETSHSLLQAELAFWFRSHKTEWDVRVMTELRTRVSADHIRIPDVCVVANDSALAERVRKTPPLIAIEILSPEDRLHRVIHRLNEFLAMGTPHVWLFDPADRVAYTCTPGGLNLVKSDRLSIPNSPIYLDLPELFAALD